MSLLTNKEAIAIHHDAYGLQPIKVDEPTPGIQIWVKPMAITGRRAVGILNRTDASAKVRINWEKLGLKGSPKALRDVWNGRNLDGVNTELSVPAHDLALLTVDGEDKAPAEYAANQNSITGVQATRTTTFARLQYVNTSGRPVVIQVKSTSGLSTALVLSPTVGSQVGTLGLILPHGTADLSFEKRPAEIRKLDVYTW